MQTALQHVQDIRVFQKLGRVDSKSLDAVDQLILILPDKPTAAHFQKIPQGSKMLQVLRKHAASAIPAFTTRLANKRQTLVVGGTIAADASTFEQLTLGRKLVAAACTQKAGCLGICVIGFDSSTQATLCNNILAAALAAAFILPAYKSEVAPATINSIRLLGMDERPYTSRTEAASKRNNLSPGPPSLPPPGVPPADGRGPVTSGRVLPNRGNLAATGGGIWLTNHPSPGLRNVETSGSSTICGKKTRRLVSTVGITSMRACLNSSNMSSE